MTAARAWRPAFAAEPPPSSGVGSGTSPIGGVPLPPPSSGVAYLPDDESPPAPLTTFEVGRHVVALSPRQVECLQRIARGLTNREIGAELGLTENTVGVHIKGLFSKLGARDRANAVALGFCYGVLVMPDRGRR